MTLLVERNKKLWHEVTTLRAQLSACQTITMVQAEVIKAQHANLDAARKALMQIKIWLKDADMTYSMHNGVRTENEIYIGICAALEGVELEEK